MSMMNSEPHTEAQVTNRLRSSRTISGSPLGASVGRSRIRSSRRARSSNARPPRPRGDGCATMCKPRRSSGPSPSRGVRAPPPAAQPSPRGRGGRAFDERARRLDRMRDRPTLAPSGEPEIVRELRSRFVTWASVCGSLFIIDIATGNHAPGFSLVVAGVWAGWKLVPRYVRLWHAGYSWRDVFARPPAPDAIEAQLAAVGSRPVELPRATTDEFGGHAEPIQQARSDRKAILRIVDRLPKSERKLLPDVVATADGLLNRAEELARTLHAMSGSVDRGALSRLEERIQATK